MTAQPRFDMARPHHNGHTVFCGEATSPHVNVTIQSAIQTGMDAAQELLDGCLRGSVGVGHRE